MRRLVSSIVGLAILGSPIVALADDAPAPAKEKPAKKTKAAKTKKAPKAKKADKADDKK